MDIKFCVTLSSKLNENDIRDSQTFNYSSVIDLRRCSNNGPLPIEEKTLRKLANFRVTYEQMPMALYTPNARKQNELFRMITEQRGSVLVLTDEMVPMVRFCEQLNIPFSSRDLYIVETASDYEPVQMLKQATQRSQFGCLAG